MSNPEPSSARAEGGCQCGAIRFALRETPSMVYACHCSECRKQSASAFGISVMVSRDGIDVLRGTPKLRARPTKSGDHLECAFCPDCGSRLWHGFAEGYSVKGGALDDTPEPRAHIWVSRKLPWVILPADLPVWPQEPED